MRIRLNSMHVIRKCLPAKSALQETQKAGCSLISKYAWVSIFLSPAVRLQIEHDELTHISSFLYLMKILEFDWLNLMII